MNDANANAPAHPFARDTARFLQQGVDLLESLDDAQYAATLPPVFASPVGAHIRHVLDHVDCLFAGRHTGRVDYDARARDARVENDRVHAIRCLRAAIAQLEGIAIDDGARPLEVRLDAGPDGDIWGPSSLTRELQFLCSHTIHHYALVAAILQHAGCAPRPGFGISPSTLRHERRRSRPSR